MHLGLFTVTDRSTLMQISVVCNMFMYTTKDLFIVTPPIFMYIGHYLIFTGCTKKLATNYITPGEVACLLCTSCILPFLFLMCGRYNRFY